jgi:nucleotide-binding universal stress UspA family protein
MDKILVAVDGSEGADRAARFAADLARTTQAGLELMYVYDAPTAIHLGLRASSEQQLSEAGEAVARGAIANASRAIGENVRAEHHLGLGDPATEIVRRARDTGADLIVVGASGLRGPEGPLLGTVARRVLQLAEVPVTIVP